MRCRVHLDAAPDANPHDDRVRTFIYRSAKELLFNVIKHSGVAEAYLSLELKGHHVVLSVQDKGRGLNPEALKQKATGLGLVSIRERAELLGGRLEVVSDPPAGCTFTLTMPIEQPEAQGAETAEAARRALSG